MAYSQIMGFAHMALKLFYISGYVKIGNVAVLVSWREPNITSAGK